MYRTCSRASVAGFARIHSPSIERQYDGPATEVQELPFARALGHERPSRLQGSPASPCSPHKSRVQEFHTSSSHAQVWPTPTAAQRAKRRTAHAAAAMHALRSAHQDELDAKRAAYALRMAYGRPQRRRYRASSVSVVSGQTHSSGYAGQPALAAPAPIPASSTLSPTSPHQDVPDSRAASAATEEPVPSLTVDQLCGALPAVQRFQTPRTARGIAMLGATLHTVQGQAVLLSVRWVRYPPGSPVPPESPAPGLWISVMHLLTARQWSGKVPLRSLQRCADEFVQACLQWHTWGKAQRGFAEAVARHTLAGPALPGTQRFGRAARPRRSVLSHTPQYLEISQPTTWLGADQPSKIQPSPDDLHTSAGHVLHCSAALGAACVEIPSLDNLRALSVSQSEGQCTIAGAKGVMPRLEVSVAAYEQAGLLATRVRTSTAGGWKIELLFEARPAVAQTERMPQAVVAASQLRPLTHADGSKLMLRVAPALRRRRRPAERAVLPGPVLGKQAEAWQLKFRLVHLDPVSLQVSTKTVSLAQALKEKHVVTRWGILAHLSRRLVSYVTAAEAQLIERLLHSIAMPADNVPLGLVPLAARHAQHTAAPPTRAPSTAGTHLLVSRLGTRATGGALKSATTHGSARSGQSALLPSVAPGRAVLGDGAKLDAEPAGAAGSPSASHWRVLSVASVPGVMSVEPEAMPVQGRLSTAQRILNQLDVPATQRYTQLRGPRGASPTLASSGAEGFAPLGNARASWPPITSSLASTQSAAGHAAHVPGSLVSAAAEAGLAGCAWAAVRQAMPARPPRESPQLLASASTPAQATARRAAASSAEASSLAAEGAAVAQGSVPAVVEVTSADLLAGSSSSAASQLAQAISVEHSPHRMASNSSETAQPAGIADVPAKLSSRPSVILELSEGEHDTREGHSSPELSTRDEHCEQQATSRTAADESPELSRVSSASTPAVGSGCSSPRTTELSAGLLLASPGSPSLPAQHGLPHSQDSPHSTSHSSTATTPLGLALHDIADGPTDSWAGKGGLASGSGYVSPATQPSGTVQQQVEVPGHGRRTGPSLPAAPVSSALASGRQLASPHDSIDGKCSCESACSAEHSMPVSCASASASPRECCREAALESDEEAAYAAQLEQAQRQGETAAHEVVARLREEAQQAAQQRVAEAHQATHALSFVRDRLLDMDASDATSIDVSTSEDDMDVDYDIHAHFGTLHAH